MELAQKTKFLRQCRPFSYMADEDVTLFAQSARLIDCAASTLLYREKDSAKGLIVVISDNNSSGCATLYTAVVEQPRTSTTVSVY